MNLCQDLFLIVFQKTTRFLKPLEEKIPKYCVAEKKLPKELRYTISNVYEDNEYSQSKYSKVIEESYVWILDLFIHILILDTFKSFRFKVH